MAKQYDAGVEELLALRSEASKAIEADPVVTEVYEVFNDLVFMMKTLPDIWASWGVTEVRGLVKVRFNLPGTPIPMHLRVNNPLWSEEFVRNQRNLADRPKADVVKAYKESISISPILTGIAHEMEDGEGLDQESPFYEIWEKVMKETENNPLYGGSGCGTITLRTPEYACQDGLFKMMVGTNCLTGGFLMAAVESSPRTKGVAKFQSFSSFEKARSFFALPYQEQKWDELFWNDYYRAVFKIGAV